MPKEIIQWPRTDGYSGTELSVHWSKHTADEVQIGLTRHVWAAPIEATDSGHADHQHCSECTVDDADGLKATVFTDPMTRREINNLIRMLRRARDDAFGRDE